MKQKFTKKPVTIEAMQYDGSPESNRAIIDWTRGTQTPAFMDKDAEDRPILMINTLEGAHTVTVGDMVIKGVKGEFYPCKREIFDLSYDVAGSRGRNMVTIRGIHAGALAPAGSTPQNRSLELTGEHMGVLRDPVRRQFDGARFQRFELVLDVSLRTREDLEDLIESLQIMRMCIPRKSLTNA